MLFHSIEFVVGFLPATVLAFFLIARYSTAGLATAVLVLASLIFYAWGTAAHVVLIAGSVSANYLLARAIRARRARGHAHTARTITTAGIVANLTVLGYFKYYNFLAENFAALLGGGFVFTEIILPLAISFFTLQQIAYLVDVYRGLADEHSFLHYALFVTFFPQLIAGPIVYHTEMLPQFRRKETYWFSADHFSTGLVIFLLGLAKKTVIADSFGAFASPVFTAVGQGAEPSLYAAWSATFAFSFEIYFDFSAYSDMAIGLARMFSIRLPMNFDSPYQATSVIAFWRRWHMTLSRFLRDYLYIPLGGGRRGRARRYANLLVTMLIGGLWHGAAWGFVIWGGLHGVYLVINHFWRRIRPPREGADAPAGRGARIGARTLTFLAVTVAWVFFRSNDLDAALRMFGGMAGRNGASLPAQLLDLIPALSLVATPRAFDPLLGGGTVLGFVELAVMLALGFAIVFLFPNLHRMSPRARLLWLVPSAGLLVHEVFFGGAASEFIYFRF